MCCWLRCAGIVDFFSQGLGGDPVPFQTCWCQHHLLVKFERPVTLPHTCLNGKRLPISVQTTICIDTRLLSVSVPVPCLQCIGVTERTRILPHRPSAPFVLTSAAMQRALRSQGASARRVERFRMAQGWNDRARVVDAEEGSPPLSEEDDAEGPRQEAVNSSFDETPGRCPQMRII